VSHEPDYTVRLEQVFQGPMDLLLHLVREQEVEIHEIEIARIIDGFLAYLRQVEELDLELAGDFVVMAATLMAIKSRSLLPTEEVDLEDDLDPRDELIERLIEYRRFREASEALEARFRRRAATSTSGTCSRPGRASCARPTPTARTPSSPTRTRCASTSTTWWGRCASPAPCPSPG